MSTVTLNGNPYPDNILSGFGYLTPGAFGDVYPLWQKMWVDGKADLGTSSTLAQNWASLTGSLVASTDYSAKEWAQGTTALSSKSWATLTGAYVTGTSLSAQEWAAGTYKRGAAGFGSAKDWATLLAATADNAEYSAKEYAIGMTVAAGSSKSWATLTGAYVTGTSLSAQEWATGTYKRGSAGYGSAQDWAMYIGGTVDGTNYSAKYNANLAAASATAAAASVVALSDTSSTSLTIGTGSNTFTVSAGKQFITGEFITAAYTTTPANYMHGQVTSYSGTTLIVNVTDVGGSGTYSAWTISPSGSQGTTGASGANTILQGGAAGGTANALTVSTQGAISTALRGYHVTVTTGGSASSATSATLSVDTSGVKSISINGSTTLALGALPANTTLSFDFDGTNWQLAGGSGSSDFDQSWLYAF